MGNWFDEARRRVEHKQQQDLIREQQVEQTRLHMQQLEQKRQQRICDELLRILIDVDAQKKLDFVRQNIWGCGQIDPIPIWFNSEPIIVGLKLHYEYEALKFVVSGGGYESTSPGEPDPMYNIRFIPETKALSRSTVTREIIITARQNQFDGSRQLWFQAMPLSTPVSNLASLVQELDDMIYKYYLTSRSPLEEKVKQDRINQEEEKAYHNYEARGYRDRYTRGGFRF